MPRAKESANHQSGGFTASLLFVNSTLQRNYKSEKSFQVSCIYKKKVVILHPLLKKIINHKFAIIN